MATSTLSETDRGRTIHVRSGDLVVISLAENPTTGYRWAVDPPASHLLVELSSELEPAVVSGVGGGGRRRLTYRAVQSGTARLSLTLRRAWEAAGLGIDHYEVAIEIGI